MIEILRRFPNLVDPDKEIPDADPFIIALAMVGKGEMRGPLFGGKCIVVTQEKPTKGGRPKIPDVCNFYGIKPISLREMYSREQWQY